MVGLLNGFVVELRNAGLPVSLTENLDAMEAVQHIPVDDREAFKYALGATLVKNNSHWRAFETVFEVYFSLRGPEYRLLDADESELDELWRNMQDEAGRGDGRGAAGGGLDALTAEEIAQLLMQALLGGDQAMMRAMARQAVQRFAGMEPGRPGRRHLLPVPDAAQPRPRRAAREVDGGVAADGRGRAHAARGAARARGVPGSHRSVQGRGRGGDPPPPRRRPRGRGDGEDAAQAAARGRRVHACQPRRDAAAAQGAVSADPQARRPPGAQAAARTQGPARLPQHGAPLAVVRWRAGRAEVQVPAAGEAGADRRRRHLRLGGGVRPLHADARLRHPAPVRQGALVRVHRRHRRGHRLLQADRGRR